MTILWLGNGIILTDAILNTNIILGACQHVMVAQAFEILTHRRILLGVLTPRARPEVKRA